MVLADTFIPWQIARLWASDERPATGAHCLQEIYSWLEEPDGLSGLVRLRSGGPRLEDQV